MQGTILHFRGSVTPPEGRGNGIFSVPEADTNSYVRGCAMGWEHVPMLTSEDLRR